MYGMGMSDALSQKALPALQAGGTVTTASGQELDLGKEYLEVPRNLFVAVTLPELSATVLPDGETITVEFQESNDGGANYRQVGSDVFRGKDGIGSKSNRAKYHPVNNGVDHGRESRTFLYKANVICSAGVVPPTETPVLEIILG